MEGVRLAPGWGWGALAALPSHGENRPCLQPQWGEGRRVLGAEERGTVHPVSFQ